MNFTNNSFYVQPQKPSTSRTKPDETRPHRIASEIRGARIQDLIVNTNNEWNNAPQANLLSHRMLFSQANVVFAHKLAGMNVTPPITELYKVPYLGSFIKLILPSG